MKGIFTSPSTSTVRFHIHPPFSSTSHRRIARPPPVRIKGFAASTSTRQTRRSNDNNNPYEILKVGERATVVEIKNAYRSLAKRFHPDAATRCERNRRDDCDEFIRIHDAYVTLSDPETRAEYDRLIRPVAVSLRRETAYATAGKEGFGDVRTRKWETDQLRSHANKSNNNGQQLLYFC